MVTFVERRKKPNKTVDRMARLRKLFPSGPAKEDIREVLDIERNGVHEISATKRRA
jgi:hypothetical protein